MDILWQHAEILMSDCKNVIMLFGGSVNAFNNFRYPLIKCILDQNKDATIYCISFSADERPAEKFKNLPICWKFLNGCHAGLAIFDFLPILKFIYILLLIKPNILLAFNAKPIFYMGITSFLNITPRNSTALLEGLGLGFQSIRKRGILNRLKNLIIFSSFFHIRKWIFLNHFDQKLLRKKKLLRKSAVTITINGIGTNYGINLTEASIKKRWKKQSIGFCGRLIEQKGLTTFLETSRIVKSRMQNVQFNIAGRHSKNSSYSRNEIESWSSDGIIDSINYYEDIQEFYETNSLIILPTYYNEGLPAVAMECQALGIPIFLNKIPQLLAAVSSEQKNQLIKNNNPASYAELIFHYLSSFSQYLKYSKLSNDYALAQFDTNSTNAKIWNFLKI